MGRTGRTECRTVQIRGTFVKNTMFLLSHKRLSSILSLTKHVSFTDFENALDRLDRNILWQVFEWNSHKNI